MPWRLHLTGHSYGGTLSNYHLISSEVPPTPRIDQSVFSRIFIDEIIHISSSEPDISLHTTLLRLVHVAACVNSSLLFIVDCVPLYG